MKLLNKGDDYEMTLDATAENFSQQLNTKFRVKVDAPEPVELELVEVAVRSPEPNEQAGMERFSIFFYGPAKYFLPQQTCALEHPEMGEQFLFLVPIGHDSLGVKYEAVFNRFITD